MSLPPFPFFVPIGLLPPSFRDPPSPSARDRLSYPRGRAAGPARRGRHGRSHPFIGTLKQFLWLLRNGTIHDQAGTLFLSLTVVLFSPDSHPHVSLSSAPSLNTITTANVTSKVAREEETKESKPTDEVERVVRKIHGEVNCKVPTQYAAKKVQKSLKSHLAILSATRLAVTPKGGHGRRHQASH